MSIKFTILGCGSSMGVPRPDGYFGNCDPKNIKNYRTRCSGIIQTKSDNILIDTSPDLRNQLINNNIKKIDKVLYSHMHADQTHGINDLRIFFIKNRRPIPIYTDKKTKYHLIKTFSYCFKKRSKEYPAILKIKSVKNKFTIKDGLKDVPIKSVVVEHGKVKSICYIIDKKLAYISDVSKIYKKDHKYFKNLKYLIIDCLWYRSHPSHLNFTQSIELIKLFKPKKAILTNLHCDIDYEELKKKLPKNVIPAYDGLKVDL